MTFTPVTHVSGACLQRARGDISGKLFLGAC